MEDSYITEEKNCKKCNGKFTYTSLCYCYECLKNNETKAQKEALVRFNKQNKWHTRKKISYGILIYTIMVSTVWYKFGIMEELLCVMSFSLGIVIENICYFLADKF